MGKTKPIHRHPSVVQTPLKMPLQWAELHSLRWRRNPLLAAKGAPSTSISRDICMESKQPAPHDKESRQLWYRTCQQSSVEWEWGHPAHCLPMLRTNRWLQLQRDRFSKALKHTLKFQHVRNCTLASKALTPGKQRRLWQGTGIKHGLVNLAMMLSFQ